MIIHTLGPDSTDSYAAAQSLISSEEDDIVGYPSFDAIIHQLEQLKGDCVLFPVAFQSARKAYGWKEFNYDYWDKVELMHVFSKKTKPMVLIENSRRTEDRAMIHPATTIFLEKYLSRTQETIPITFTDSKVKAWTAFQKKGLKYTIISEDVYEEEKNSYYQLVERYEPEMVWCLYKIKQNEEM
ncbi:hypothetical protein ADIAL_1816 [Alkalibacterium sp. AK22]|uniref:hypothetical protein n=1 Tax=Alkalibacterium sp. AK22 TaxID=1229520 RepID=UPI0004496D53|nr:hypothetical protein [Alkalibacterium sp. AK22]EXJ22701.1 hypothetical protein ADIAL_1816 [Alkalibacterium sp. AK22]